MCFASYTILRKGRGCRIRTDFVANLHLTLYKSAIKESNLPEQGVASIAVVPVPVQHRCMTQNGVGGN